VQCLIAAKHSAHRHSYHIHVHVAVVVVVVHVIVSVLGILLEKRTGSRPESGPD